MKSTFVLLFLVSLISAASTLGQIIPASPAWMPETDKRLREIENKALSRLDATIDEAQSLKLPENRIYIFCSAADLLWTRDEKRARELFGRAGNEIIAVNNQSEADEIEVSKDFLALHVIRNEFLNRVANRDAEYALELVRRTRPSAVNKALNLPGSNRLGGDLRELVQTEIALEKSFAVQMSRQNPRRALEIARANLSRGASSTDLNLINQLNIVDPEAASQFANEVLQKLVTSDLSDSNDNSVRQVTAHFLAEFSANAVGNQKQLQINEAVWRRLAEKYADYFLSEAARSADDYEIEDAIPLFEKILPERVAALRQKYAKPSSTKEKIAELTQNTLPETIISEAQNFPSQMRPQIYNSAANKAAQTANYAEARRLLGALPDKQNRERALLELDQKTFTTDLNQAKYEEADQIIQLQSVSSQKILFLVQIARHFYNKRQNEKAFQYLSQAYSLINAKPENNRELSDFIEVLDISPEISPEKTFALVDSFIPEFNEILSANALPGKNQQCNCTFRDGEFVLSTINNGFRVNDGKTAGIYISLRELRFMFLARVDLERAMILADEIERRDVRIATRLLMLHGILFGGKTTVYLR